MARPEDGLADEGAIVELIELHSWQRGHHVHEILRHDPYLRHRSTQEADYWKSRASFPLDFASQMLNCAAQTVPK